MKYFLTTLASIAFIATNAQFFNPKEYDWEKAQYENVTVDDSTDMYILLNKQLFNYYYEDNGLMEHYLFHKKIHINSSDAIEGLNKIYVSQSEDNLIQFKARSISPGGKITEIKEDKILKGVDEDSEQEYLYFAFEGLEIGSQIEFFYIKNISPRLNGVTFEVQGGYPTKRVEIDVISPWNLVMASKVYNMDQQFEKDTAIEEQRIFFHTDSLAPLKKESTAFRDANYVRVIYKLDENLYNHKKNIVAYSHISQNVVDNVNRELSKKEIKALSKIEKEIDKFEPENQVSDIRRIENYLKTNYQYIDVSNEILTNIASIYNNKAFNQYGGLLVYNHLLKNKGIDYKLVYTTDRSEEPFDPDFESNAYMDNLLLYIPDEDSYLDFTSPLSRMGYTDAMNTSNYGLFIEEVKLNENPVAVATTEFIPAKPASFTTDSMDVRVEFGEDLYENSLFLKRVLTGYTAAIYQPLFSFIRDEDSKKEFQESILTYINSEAEVKDMEILNGSANMLGVKPLTVSGKLEGANYMEKAGPNFLFKIGSLIGPQSEMYDENEERVMDIESDHTRTYIRKITFTIPDGYEISGLEDLKMDVKLAYKDDSSSSRFASDYTKDGNTITVSIVEYYNEVKYPKDLFEDYKKVINAAADFNKKTLLLKKAS